MQRSFPIERLGNLLGSRVGLSAAEAANRLLAYGSNEIIPTEAHGWLAPLKDAAKDPMVWFLVATGLLFFALGDNAEAITLMVATVPLVAMDLYLHRRTRASTEGLAGHLAPVARVRRDNGTVEIPANQIVPGDLVIVRSGETFPADGVLVSSESIQVDESILTGEAWPVAKWPLTAVGSSESNVKIEGQHWTWAGTRALTGVAEVRIANTAAQTMFGEIVRSARAGGAARTPLQRAIARLVSILIIASISLCLLLAIVRYSQGFGIVDALLSALTLAVAALPEEFPVLLTVFLGVGVYRLAQRKALVQRAVVVENIGRVTCICTDKTGTLTENRLVLAHDYPAARSTHDGLREIASMASRQDSGDPMDAAILAETAPLKSASLVTSFPFTEARKHETNVWRREDGTMLAATKGAPEQVLAMCDLQAEELGYWTDQVGKLASGGHKLIACASAVLPGTDSTPAEPLENLRFAGLLAFENPVRESAAAAVEACRAAGIHVIMITGDLPQTAEAVAREIGLGEGHPRVVEADALGEQLGDGRALIQIDVIARALPAQKVEVVRGLQSAGEIIAVTGDGVNDVPALQIADIGLAMGEHGTRSATEVADIVLLDENFRTIIGAISEGRQLFRNLRLGFAYLLAIHVPLVATAALIPLFGYPLLYLPVHVVWLELIIHPTAMLVFQELPPDRRLGRLQRRGSLAFFTRREWMAILIAGAAATLMITGSYLRSLGHDIDVQHARSMALAMLSLSSAVIVVVLSGLRTTTARVIAAATVLLAIMLIESPIVEAVLKVEALHLDDWLIAVVGSVLVGGIIGLGRFRTA